MKKGNTLVCIALMLIATTIMSACSGVRKIDRELDMMTDSQFEKNFRKVHGSMSLESMHTFVRFGDRVLENIERELESGKLNAEERFDARNTRKCVIAEREAMLKLIEEKEKSSNRKKKRNKEE